MTSRKPRLASSSSISASRSSASIPLASEARSFVFNDTATTEIYTTHNTLPYSTLFRSTSGRPPTRVASPRTSGSAPGSARPPGPRSEEHTSELQSLCVISYAVFCLKKKKKHLAYLVSCFRIYKKKYKD